MQDQVYLLAVHVFLSTPSARRATCLGSLHPQKGLISIHALREEGDYVSKLYAAESPYFYPRPPRGGRRCQQSVTENIDRISIHALREEGDETVNKEYIDYGEFLSTPSARRATANVVTKLDGRGNFYPRPPRGGRLPTLSQGWMTEGISIHALREEGDVKRC